MYKFLVSFTDIFYIYESFIPNLNYIYEMLSCSVDFNEPQELWNAMSKALPSSFHWCDRQSKCNCLYDRANFHMASCLNH